ncbi:MAG: nucleoside-diphosphate sugar epimerase/dehydratase [Bacteroidales bacterium]
MKTNLSQFMQLLTSGLSKKGVLNIYIPRWIIFLLDILLIMGSYLLIAILYRLVFHRISGEGFEMRLAFTLAVYGIIELSTRVYRGTIRYSGLAEMVRLFLFVGCSMGVTIFGTSLIGNYYPVFETQPMLLILHGALTFFLLFTLRICVKYSYYFLTTLTSRKKRVVVFGSDPNSLAMAQTLSIDTESTIKPVGMIDSEGTMHGKRISGMPVVKLPESSAKVMKFMEEVHAEKVIFTEERLKSTPSDVIDLFLHANIKMLVVGSTTDLNEHNKRQKSARMSVNEIRIEDLLNRAVIQTDNSVVAEKHHDRIILVSGAAGSIGSEIVNQVAGYKPQRLILLDQAESPLHDLELKIRSRFPELDLVVFIGDVRNKTRMEELFSTYRPQVVYHAAAYKHVPMMERYPAESIRVNVMGTKIMADLAVKYEARKFVMVSTDKAVNPTNVMGASKRIAEIYVQSLYLSLAHLTEAHRKRTRFITTRFGNVLGSNGSVVPLFKDQIAKGGPVTITHKDIIRYFMTIPEACKLVLEAGCMGKGGEIFVFDMGEPVKIYDLAKRMIHLAGLRPFLDINIIETGLRPGEKLYEELLNDEELTVPTHHEKIMVAKVREYDYPTVCAQIDSLISEACAGNGFEVVRKMKGLVPEFKSKNSVFESLDVVEK